MATFVGYSTINRNKQFTLVDDALIKQDLLNAFNIRQGELPGRPGYGTIIWSFLFENQLPDTQQAIYDEVQRVAGGDPRLYIQNVYSYPQQNGMLIQIILQTVATTTAQQLSIFFDQTQRSASYV
jgi:phage baseplate assembly protein W